MTHAHSDRNAPDVLVVVHGPGRGRLAGFRDHLFDWFARHRPEVAARIVVHRTGAAPPDLSGIRAMACWLADPLRELYPEEHAEAVMLADAVRARGGQVLNPPEALSNTIKSVQARLWKAAGIPAAPAVPFAAHDGLSAAVAAVGLPAIVRADLHHAQEEVFLCREPADVERLPVTGRLYPAVALGFVDVRAAWAAHDPRDLRARLWHKKRSFVLGERVVPNHCLFANNPVVGLKASTWWRYRSQRSWFSAMVLLSPRQRAELAADRRAGLRPAEHVELLVRATRALGLHQVAVDYSDLPDGGVILWEANPYFTLPVGRKGPAARLRQLQVRLDRFGHALADHLVAAADTGPSGDATPGTAPAAPAGDAVRGPG